MTLILGMSKAEGIYMSVDYRVTQAGKLIDDTSTKFLTVHYPPHDGGPKALFAYTGVATLPDGTPMGSWIRETLRGEAEYVDQSMAHLRTRLDRDIAELRSPLIVNILIVHGKRRYLGAFSNVRAKPQSNVITRRSFGYLMRELTEPIVFANGSGAARVAADLHLDLLRSQLYMRPRKPLDHMKLLASVNRRVAAKDSTVSPFCHVSFINSDDRNSPQTQAFIEKGEVVPFDMPMLLFGIDLSGMARRSHEEFEAMLRGEDPTEDFDLAAINEELERRP